MALSENGRADLARRIVLHEGLEPVERLVDPRLEGFARGHLGIECFHLFGIRRRERAHPRREEILLALLVRGGLEEGRDIAGEGLAEVVDQAHADDLVHVRFGKGVAQEERHEREPPAVVGHALAPPAGRVAMPHGVLEPLGDVENAE